MFRPPFVARVAAGAAVYAVEETRRLPTAAVNFPITAISQLLQTSMHAQQFVTSLALKGDAVFDRLLNRPVEQPEWATFDDDLDEADLGQMFAPPTRPPRFGRPTPPSPFDAAAVPPFDTAAARPFSTAADRTGADSPTQSPRASSFDRYPDAADPEPAPTSGETASTATDSGDTATAGRATAGDTSSTAGTNGTADTHDTADPHDTADTHGTEVSEPAVATRYDYINMTLAQLRARLRSLTVDDLAALLDYERRTRDRAPFVTMLTNRIATVRAQ